MVFFFSLFTTVSLVSVKTFNRCLIDTFRNSFPIMYHFNYLIVFSDLSWILHFIEINYLLHFKVLCLNFAYLLIAFPIGRLCKKPGRREEYRRQDRTSCCFSQNDPFFRRFHLKVEVWVQYCILMNQQCNSDLIGSVSWYMFLGILCLCEHPVLSCISQSHICERSLWLFSWFFLHI